MIMKTKIAMFSAASLLLAAGTHAATITTIGAPATGEKTHAQILGDIFGGTFLPSGNDYSNGSVTVSRVDDDLDKSYNFVSWSATAHAVWAKAWQMFGTSDAGSLLNVEGKGPNATGSLSNVAGDGSVVFGRFGDESFTSNVFTDPTLNGDGLDHVVTYTYSTPNGPSNSYLLFFEDLLDGAPRHDFDYNDLVVEVSGVVPEPTSLALMGLGGLAMLRRRR